MLLKGSSAITKLGCILSSYSLLQCLEGDTCSLGVGPPALHDQYRIRLKHPLLNTHSGLNIAPADGHFSKACR